MIGQGQRTRQIAERLKVSVKTVESHRQHIKEKLNLADGHELTIDALWDSHIHPLLARRFPRATAEQLPYGDDSFDAALVQLVVHFMADPVAGLRELARVTRRHGVVAACVWDHAGGQGPLSLFWEAARELDPDVGDESLLAGARQGHLAQLFAEAGLHDVEESTLSVSVEHPSFEEWWEPFTLGVGPAGDYAAGLDAKRQARLRERCRQLLPPPPFVLTARAWAARGFA